MMLAWLLSRCDGDKPAIARKTTGRRLGRVDPERPTKFTNHTARPAGIGGAGVGIDVIDGVGRRQRRRQLCAMCGERRIDWWRQELTEIGVGELTSSEWVVCSIGSHGGVPG